MNRQSKYLACTTPQNIYLYPVRQPSQSNRKKTQLSMAAPLEVTIERLSGNWTLVVAEA